MYQEFKRKLLDEMEMRRDMIVLNSSEPSVEPIFEVSSVDDKLYRRILDEFDRIAVRYAEDLLYDLCVKHGIEATKAGNAGAFDFVMSIGGRACCVELKTSPSSFNTASYRRFIDQVQSCNMPVYLVYLLKDSQQSRNAIARQALHFPFEGEAADLRKILFEDFIAEQFGTDELGLFKKAMVTYKEEMHQAVGYQITEIFNAHNLGQLKAELKNEISNFPYDRIKRERYVELHSEDASFRDLSAASYSHIKSRFLNLGRYELLLGESDFAKSFLTSEWLYKKYFSLQELDNTFIVAGYLKSIEQLLWDIIYIIGQGRQVRGVNIEQDNFEDIDTTLGSLQYFITNYSNDDLFETVFGTSTHFVMRYLRSQLSVWRAKYRNGYFHKHNLEDKEKINLIREETFFLYLLILGSISLDSNAMLLLS
jgi:hypothetical protein